MLSAPRTCAQPTGHCLEVVLPIPFPVPWLQSRPEDFRAYLAKGLLLKDQVSSAVTCPLVGRWTGSRGLTAWGMAGELRL